MCKDLCKLADDGKPDKFILMDTSRENKMFVDHAESNDRKLNLVWEFTARNTPWQNGLVEVEFAAIAGRARAMCNAANMPLNV